ncbi:hypothetical protein [Hymenobacter algoricola]|uniref:Uncharacterized protein n=1 Tax=Hymenobacter algoricola TaxID=486267 RepID=A0ABP7MP55_9BACT
MKHLLILLLTLLAPSASQAQSVGEIVHGNAYEGVIFPAAVKLQPQDSVRRWTPTAADIAQLERALIVFMSKQPRKSRVNEVMFGLSIHRQLSGYTRQYAGYLSPKGEKIIYVNCFWDPDNDPFLKHWPNSLIQVFDGGNAFWHIHYNTAKRRFVGLSINGVA